MNDRGCNSIMQWPNYIYGFGNIDVHNLITLNVTTCNNIYYHDPRVIFF